MANEFYTLIVVPHAKARFRKFQVSVRLTRWVLAAFGVMAVVLVGILVHYTWIAVEVAEVRRLRTENLALADQGPGVRGERGPAAGQGAAAPEHGHEAGRHGGGRAEPARRLDRRARAACRAARRRRPRWTSPPPCRAWTRRVGTLSDKSTRLEAFFKDQRELLASTPSIWPVRGYLSAGFGNRPDPFTGQRDFHPGLDISMPIGTKVHAPADGVVVSCGQQKGYGNAIVIDHGFGVVTRYGHLDGFNVRPGQRVKRGDVIGFSGNTGRSTAPHLHYEVWVNDQARNPIEYILDEYRQLRIKRPGAYPKPWCHPALPVAIPGRGWYSLWIRTHQGAIAEHDQHHPHPHRRHQERAGAEAHPPRRGPRRHLRAGAARAVRRRPRGEDRRVPGAPGQGGDPRRPAARGLRGRARGRPARAQHAPLRRPAHRRHGPPPRDDRGDEDRRGQDPRRHPRRLPERARRQGRPRGHRQRLPGQARLRVDGPALPLPRPHRRGHPAQHGRPRAPGRLRGRHHLRDEQRVRLRLPARQHEVRPRACTSSAGTTSRSWTRSTRS